MSSIPPAKRSRTNTDNNGDSINISNNTAAAAAINSTNNVNSSLNNDVITTSKILQQITTLTNDYCNATPFPHGVINNFCTDGLLGEFICCILHINLCNLLTIVHTLSSCTRYI